jgi:hypothetical protein
MRKTFVTAAALIGLTAFAAPASATTILYDFTLDGLTGSPLPAGPYGTVSVNDFGGTSQLSFDIKLAPNFFFNDSKSFQAFDYLLGGTVSTVNITTTGFTDAGLGSYTAPSIVTNGDTTKFNYAILCATLCAGGSTDGTINELIFNVTGTNLAIGSISDTNGHPGLPIYFAADIAYEGGPSVLTGNIGATLGGAVPEPETWALMLLGFGGIGLMLRARKRGTIPA